MIYSMTKKKKISTLRSTRDEMIIVQERMAMYNNTVDQILKKISRRYGRINIEIDEPTILTEMSENDNRFIDILKAMITLQEKMSHEGRRKYDFIYNQYARMVDRTASSMTKKPSSYTLNFCLRRGMCQNTIIVKKLITRLNTEIAKDEKK